MKKMIPRASRKERMNMSQAAGTAYSVTVFEVSPNRSFVMTDLRIDSSEDIPYTIFDGLSAAVATSGTEKMKFYSSPVQMTDIKNGCEFHNGVSIRSDSGLHAASAFVCWVSGYER